MAAWCGRLFGLSVSSELPLPFTPSRAAAAQSADVRVEFGAVAPADHWLTRQGEDGIQLDVKDVARFLIKGGRTIVIEPAKGVSERNLRVYLLGSAFGALLHQRRLLPLHANALLIEGKAFAFIGRSGAGKSTLAAWFQERGHAVLADDVCAVAFADGGRPVVQPGVPRLRLWKDALEHAGHDSEQFERSFDGFDKYDVPAPLEGEPEAAPLAGCYWLDEPDVAAPLRIDRMTGARAVEMLIANTYRGQFVTLLGHTAEHMKSCVQLARSVPLYRAVRRKNRDEYDNVAETLRRHALELLV